MPAYSFKERFVQPIFNRTKRQTIRGKRKHRAKPGDTLYLYFGMRTKYCKKLGEEICTDVKDIIILVTGVFIDGELLESDHEYEDLAKADGFDDWNDMWNFWKQNNSIPFNGDIIYW